MKFTLFPTNATALRPGKGSCLVLALLLAAVLVSTPFAAASDPGEGPSTANDGWVPEAAVESSVPPPPPAPPAPRVDELHFYFLEDAHRQREALMAGEVDGLLLPVPPPEELMAALADDPRIRLEAAPGSRLFHVAFNVRTWPFSDRAFRMALAQAVDRDRLVDELFGPLGFPATGYLPAFDPFFDPEATPVEFDPAGAASRLEEAGFTLDPQGVRIDPRTNAPLETRFILAPLPEEAPAAYRAATWVARAARELGIPLEVEALPWPSIMERLRRFDFDLYALSWDVPRYPAFLYSLFHSSQDVGGGLNLTGLHRHDLDRALEVLRAPASRTEARQAARQVQRILQREVPWIPLFHVPVVTAFRADRLTGLHPMPRYGAADYRNRWATLELQLLPEEGSPAGPGSGNEGGTSTPAAVRWILPGDPGSLDPFASANPGDWQILGRVYEPLWALHPETLEPAPWLASRWQVEVDRKGREKGGTRITFWLREGVQWHDGTPLTSADVRFTVDQVKAGRWGAGRAGLRDLTAVETPDPHQVVFHFSSASYWHLYHLDIPVLPRHLWEGRESGDQEDAGEEATPDSPGPTLVGTGPFRFSEGEGEGPYRLVRYESYQPPAKHHPPHTEETAPEEDRDDDAGHDLEDHDPVEEGDLWEADTVLEAGSYEEEGM